MVLILLMIIPYAFAEENTTITFESSSNATFLSSDFYFDSNATHDHGEGTSDNPYRELRDGRILDNSVIHLKNGVYEFSQLNSHNNISFIGENPSETVINGHGATLIVNTRLILTNVTLCNLNIFNQGNLIATNAIFTNSTATESGSYSDSYGGAIYCVDRFHNAYLTNCTFTNNYARYGGAIYLNGGILEINDCTFINNTAYDYGGAIACNSPIVSSPRVTIKKTKFIDDKSLNDAGGAIYLASVTFDAEDLNISNCSATFGGAIALLKSYSTLKNVYAFNNSAKYDGGVIYAFYGNLTLTGSYLVKNHAQNGGGLFVCNSFYGSVENNNFINNSAKLLAGAFYSLLNDHLKKDNNNYIANEAFSFDDYYQQDNLSLVFTQRNYTLCNYVIESGEIPKSYISPVTSVKNQENGGNCWAFAALAALESSILIATGEEVDLSEENMKNLASIYSHYGWDMDTNKGGYMDMSIGYLLSWLGPVLDSDDPYNGITVLSPVLESIIHVQNMVFLKKSDNNNISHIKRAIMDYGGVHAGIFMAAYYDSASRSYVQYYKGSMPCDHAVVLVGWDDDFYISGAPGRGAWIAKNSWGESWGDNGYFYVSYFDSSCPQIGNNEGGFAFILNDTIKYDKNYQYDVAKTDYFFNTTKTVWYKNIFNATDSEYLAAVSTYFEKVTDYTFSILVNDALKITKSGKSNPGYYTLQLDELIPLDIGDKFEVIFKITVDGDAGVPISESISLNNYFYHENISYISYDGVNWKDLFKLTWAYPDHIYDSQVACIKAFTVLNPINTTISLALNGNVITANVLNQWGYPVNCGNVVFKLDNESYNVNLVNGLADLQIDYKSCNITAEFNAVGYSLSVNQAEIHFPLINTNITLNVTGVYNPINITAEILDEFENPVKYGYVIFDIDGDEYKVEVINGSAKLENINVLSLKTEINAYYNDLFYYNSSYAAKSVETLRIKTKVNLTVTADEANNPVKITVAVTDFENNPVNQGHVLILLDGDVYSVEVENGTAQLNYTFTEIGSNIIYVIYFDNYLYEVSRANETLNVSKMKVNLTFDMKIYENNAVLTSGIKDCARGFKTYVYLNDEMYTYLSTEGYVLCEFKDLDAGSYNYTIRLDSPIYEADDLKGQFNITYHKTNIMAFDADLYYNAGYSVILMDDLRNFIPDRDVYLTVNGQTYKKRTGSAGVAVFNMDIPIGEYEATVNFIGDDEYVKSSLKININVKSTVKFSSAKYAYNSNYVATLYDSYGNLMVNKQVKVVFNNAEYKLATDSKGQISLNIKVGPGNYAVKITNPLTGEVKTQNINVVKRITSNRNLNMYYGAGSVYKVRVCDDNGKFSKGLKVTFKINGKSYYAYTDKKGYASYKITQKVGKYTITAQYKGFKVSNKVNVKSTIITKNIKVKKGKTIKFTAKLLNKKGKILKNKKITFKFKGKTYKVKTNKKGKAVLKITKKYKKGKYTITSSYGKLSIKNSIRIK